MEKAFELTVEIGGHDKNREKEVIKACMVEWNFREEDFSRHTAPDGKSVILEASAVGIIYEDEDKDEFAQRLSRAVWRANGGVLCHVEVRAMGLKSMKSETLGWREDEHESIAA
jgi:hypothetical protein